MGQLNSAWDTMPHDNSTQGVDGFTLLLVAQSVNIVEEEEGEGRSRIVS